MHSAEWLRGAIHVAKDCEEPVAVAYYTKLLAEAEARESGEPSLAEQLAAAQAEAKQWRDKCRVTQAKLENMAIDCGQAEGLLKRCREEAAQLRQQEPRPRASRRGPMSNERNAKHLEYVMQGVATDSHRKALEAGAAALREADRLRAELAAAKAELVAINNALCPSGGMSDNRNLAVSVKNLNDSHRRMCDVLRQSVVKHKLGYGGEYLDELVVESLGDATARAEKAESELAAHIEESLSDNQAIVNSLNKNTDGRLTDGIHKTIAKAFDAAVAERDALAAHVARLREAINDSIDAINSPFSGDAVTDLVNYFAPILSATPAQSLARVRAAALREAAGTLGVQAPIRTSQYDDFGSGKEKAWEDCMELLESMASRLEAEAANG